MNGKKIEQAKGALKFFVNSLQAHDYFNVIPFSTAARPFFPQPVQASAENIDKALKLAASIKARGGTNIEKGITTALKASIPMEDVALMEMTVFLTDGLPTVDTTNPARLLEIIKDSNKNKHRIFVFGVGNDVNTKLLDKIASQNRGARDYVREHEDIEVRTGALFTKLSHPVMSDVRIDCDGIDAFDVFPRDTPDLFKGSRLLLTGRYKATGSHAIRLTGTVNGEQKTYVYEASLPKTRLENDFLATLWAQRKVAVLLDNLRLNGHSDELVQEIRRIGGEHGIITPYTSHLILEEGQAVARHRLGWKVSRRPNLEQALTDRIQAPGAAAPATQDRVRKELLRSGEIDEVAAEAQISSLAKRVKDSRKAAKLRLQGFSGERGRAAVGNSAGLSRLSQSVAITKGDSAANLVTKNIQGHTFHLVQGVWIDRAFTAAMKDKIHKVKPFSDEYFKLTKRHPELARILAFSTRILVVIDGKAIEIS